MGISAKHRWRSSEEIAFQLLEKLGYQILEKHVKIKVEGVEVSEVDAIAMGVDGVKYAVEVKAGRIDVTGIRQAYVNAELLGCKPLIVAKGYSDDSALVLAEKLGVKVIQLRDYFLVEAEEIETIVDAALKGFTRKILEVLTRPRNLGPEDYDFLKIIAFTDTLKDASEKLDSDIHSILRRIKHLQNKGVLSKKNKNYQDIRLEAYLLVLREDIRRIINKLDLVLEDLHKLLNNTK